MVTVDFHCHTCHSRDSLIQIPRLLTTCRKKGLQRLVITDHNTIEGALQAQILDPQIFIIGEEILTRQGELLGIFVKESVPAGLSAIETVQMLRDQGSFISVSHPFDALRKGHWNLDDLLEIIAYIDAIEVFNSRCLSPQSNQQAMDFAREHNLLATVGSDAHSLSEVGSATLTLPEFNGPASLRQALVNAQSRVRLSSLWVHIFSRYASWRKGRLR